MWKLGEFMYEQYQEFKKKWPITKDISGQRVKGKYVEDILDEAEKFIKSSVNIEAGVFLYDIRSGLPSGHIGVKKITDWYAIRKHLRDTGWLR